MKLNFEGKTLLPGLTDYVMELSIFANGTKKGPQEIYYRVTSHENKASREWTVSLFRDDRYSDLSFNILSNKENLFIPN